MANRTSHCGGAHVQRSRTAMGVGGLRESNETQAKVAGWEHRLRPLRILKDTCFGRPLRGGLGICLSSSRIPWVSHPEQG